MAALLPGKLLPGKGAGTPQDMVVWTRRCTDLQLARLIEGMSTHTCAAQALAKIQGHAILTAFAKRIRRIHVGEPKRHLNNVIRETLPVTGLDLVE